MIAVDASEAKLECYLAGYRFRYSAAVEDFDAWDDMSKDWGPEHDHMAEELLDKYQVFGSLIKETTFKIVECLSSGRPFRDEADLEPVVLPASHA